MSTAAAHWFQLERKTAQVHDDIQLSYIDVGPRDGVPIVLVHGWPDIGFGWRHQIGPLSQHYRVIVPDNRGFGRSSKPTDVSKYGSKNITSDYARLLDILEIPKAVFIGHDWGGAMVWRMCLYHPDRVIAAAVVCTPYLPPTQEYVDIETFIEYAPQFSYMKLLSFTESSSKLLDQAPRRLFTMMYRHYYELPKDQSLEYQIQHLMNVEESLYSVKSDLLSDEELDFYVKEYSASGFRACVNWYATRRIDFETERELPTTINHKALFIGARDDAVLKPELAVNMPKDMPNLEMKIIDGAGHWVLWEQSEEVTSTLLNWLESVQEETP